MLNSDFNSSSRTLLVADSVFFLIKEMPVSYGHGEATDECSPIDQTSAQGLKYSHQAANCQVAFVNLCYWL